MSRYGLGRHFSPDVPWLLRHFDQIRWFPVEPDELLEQRADARAGRLELDILDSTFRLADHRAFVAQHAASIAEFEATREAAYAEERAAWERTGEFTRDHDAGTVPTGNGNGHTAIADVPPGASVLASPLAGAVAQVHRRELDDVKAGEPVVTIEAMKMEHHVPAPRDARIDRMVCREGDVVGTGAPLAVLVPHG